MESFTLRPLGIPEIIDAAIRIIRRRTRPLVTIAAVVLVPIAIVQYFISRSLQAGVAGLQTISPSADPNEVFEQMMESLGPLLVVSLTTGAIGWLAQLLVLLALTKAIVDIYLDRPPEWKESLRYGLRRLPAAIGASVIAFIPLLVGFLLYVLPGVALATLWSLTGVAIAAEGRGPGAGLSRSFDLVKKRFWPMLGVLILSILITVVIGLVIGLVIGAATIATPTIQLEVQTLLSTAISIFTTPFTAAILTVAYFDLRVRLEGFDLELMAQSTTDSPVPPAPEAAVFPPPPDDNDPFGLGRPGGL